MQAFGYIGVFSASAVLSLFLTPLAIRFALRRRIVDEPGPNKSHASPVPYLGGTAIVASFVVAVVLAAVARGSRNGLVEIVIVLALGLIVAAVGLIDDLRPFSPVLRLTVEIGVAIGLWVADVRIVMFGSDLIGFVVTIVWVVGLMNAQNFIDGADGLSAGVAAIAAGWFLVIAGASGQFLVAALSAALAGCAVGFLRHNFQPARIYMGDSGALFLGFMLAYLGIKVNPSGPDETTFLVPILVLAVPIFEATFISINRLAHKRNPMLGGLDHIIHRLVKVGLSVPVAVGIMYAVGAGVGWVAVVVNEVGTTASVLLAALVALYMVVAGVLLSFVPVYQTSRSRHFAWQEVVSDVPSPADSGPLADEHGAP
jgi:UDP-GlcNAc:undecaprenyl-phosphate GlcNAc-1-phosphate transferase